MVDAFRQIRSSPRIVRGNLLPANTIRGDTVLKAGEAPFNLGGATARWGDYSNTVVDPANDTDLWTIQDSLVSGIAIQ
jgi:hypothetical protein